MTDEPYTTHLDDRERVARGLLPNDPDGFLGGVAHIVGGGIPNLRFEIGEGQTLKIPEGHDVGKPGDYAAGDVVELEGPTAHHYEEMGFGRIVGEA